MATSPNRFTWSRSSADIPVGTGAAATGAVSPASISGNCSTLDLPIARSRMASRSASILVISRSAYAWIFSMSTPVVSDRRAQAFRSLRSLMSSRLTSSRSCRSENTWVSTESDENPGSRPSSTSGGRGLGQIPQPLAQGRLAAHLARLVQFLRKLQEQTLGVFLVEPLRIAADRSAQLLAHLL